MRACVGLRWLALQLVYVHNVDKITYDVAAAKNHTKGKLSPAANSGGYLGTSDHPLFCQQNTYRS
jgi:hypothetical protein